MASGKYSGTSVSDKAPAEANRIAEKRVPDFFQCHEVFLWQPILLHSNSKRVCDVRSAVFCVFV